MHNRNSGFTSRGSASAKVFLLLTFLLVPCILPRVITKYNNKNMFCTTASIMKLLNQAGPGACNQSPDRVDSKFYNESPGLY